MKTEMITVKPHDSVTDAVRLMAQNQVGAVLVVDVDVNTHVRKCAELQSAMGVRHLPVTENGVPVGILSSRDFLAYVVEGLEQVIDKIGYEDALGKGEDPYDHIGGSYGK